MKKQVSKTDFATAATNAPLADVGVAEVISNLSQHKAWVRRALANIDLTKVKIAEHIGARPDHVSCWASPVHTTIPGKIQSNALAALCGLPAPIFADQYLPDKKAKPPKPELLGINRKLADVSELKQWLAEARLASGLNKNEVSRRVGFSAQSLTNYEDRSNTKLPKLEALAALASIYGRSIPELSDQLFPPEQKIAVGKERPILKSVQDLKSWVKTARRTSGISRPELERLLDCRSLVSVENMGNTRVILSREQLSAMATICGVPEPITGFTFYRAEQTGVVVEIPDETNTATFEPVTEIGDPAEIRGWIRSLREQHGLTYREVARAIGCGPETLSEYEWGRTGPLPDPALVARLASFYGVPVPKVDGRDYGVEKCGGSLDRDTMPPPNNLADELAQAGQLMASHLPSSEREDALTAFRSYFLGDDHGPPLGYSRAAKLVAKMEILSRSLDLPRDQFDALHNSVNPVTVGSIIALARSPELAGVSLKKLDTYGRRFLNRPLIDVPASMATVACASVRLLSAGVFTEDLADHSGKTLEGIFFNAHTVRFVGSRVLMDKLREGSLPDEYTFMVAFLSVGDQSSALDNLKRLFGYR